MIKYNLVKKEETFETNKHVEFDPMKIEKEDLLLIKKVLIDKFKLKE